MGKKRDNVDTKDEEVKNVTPSTDEPTTPADDAPAKPAEDKAPVDEPTPINADEMAKEVKASTGNDYQQYMRNMFKERMEEGR